MRRAPQRGGRPSAGSAKGLCPLDSRRGYAPDPGMLTHPCLACGRDGSFGTYNIVFAAWTGLPKAGQSGRDSTEEKRERRLLWRKKDI